MAAKKTKTPTETASVSRRNFLGSFFVISETSFRHAHGIDLRRGPPVLRYTIAGSRHAAAGRAMTSTVHHRPLRVARACSARISSAGRSNRLERLCASRRILRASTRSHRSSSSSSCSLARRSNSSRSYRRPSIMWHWRCLPMKRKPRRSTSLSDGLCSTTQVLIECRPSSRNARARNVDPTKVPNPRFWRDFSPVAPQNVAVLQARLMLFRPVIPGELVLHPRAPEFAHLCAPHRVVEQLDDLRREIQWVIFSSVKRSPPGRVTSFGEIELHDRLAERHVLHDLVHGGLVVHLVGDVGIDADIGGVQ